MTDDAPWRLEVHDSLPSTTDRLAALAAKGAPDGTAVLALTQTRGRGSRGRAWSSPPGNLALSVLLRPDEPAATAAEWPLLVAIALSDVLIPRLPDPGLLSLKWPNDVLLRGRKLAGILIDATTDEGRLRTLAIGVGANLSTAPDLPDRPTAAVSEVAPPPAPEDVARALLDAMWRRRAERGRNGFAPIRAAWLSRAHPVGTPLVVQFADERLEGRFAGLTDAGLLQLQTAAGMRTLSAGEVLLGEGANG
ncbi:MAG TPA: biotin--[acetyl-CoA-carboxylase] ligase [Acidisphaera sp.]|nr:biotin--[acetyl-CoA-carboxylase] ligase [Acidisphaera sp.]